METPQYTYDQLKDYIVKKESGGNYNAKNPHSSARGAFQLINSTANAYAKKLGIPRKEMWDPANQDKMVKALITDNSKTLRRHGIPVTPGNVYGAHQQGGSGFVNIYKNNVTDKLLNRMYSNLPAGIQKSLDPANREAVRSAWLSRYVNDRTSPYDEATSYSALNDIIRTASPEGLGQSPVVPYGLGFNPMSDPNIPTAPVPVPVPTTIVQQKTFVPSADNKTTKPTVTLSTGLGSNGFGSLSKGF